RVVWKGGDWTTSELALPVVTYAELTDGEKLIAEVLRRARARQSDEQIATALTALGYHAPLKQVLTTDSVRRIRLQHGIYSRRAEFYRQGVAGWITLGEATRRLGEHTGWAYYLVGRKRLIIERDPEVGLYLVPDKNTVLKKLKDLLRGKRFSLTIDHRQSGN